MAVVPNPPQTLVNIEQKGADFILKMLSEQKLNNVNVGYVMDVTKDLLNSCMHNQMISVISTLQQSGIDATCLSGLLPCVDPFVNLKTQHSQNKFFTSNFGKTFLLYCITRELIFKNFFSKV